MWNFTKGVLFVGTLGGAFFAGVVAHALALDYQKDQLKAAAKKHEAKAQEYSVRKMN